MDHESTKCQIRVSWPSDDDPGEHSIRTLKDIKDSPAMTEALRQRWTEEILKSFSSPNPDTTIRPWDILLHHGGTIEIRSSEKGSRSSYASRYRIPAQNIVGFDEEEQIKRAERFALGSLLYEMMTASQPFEELCEDEVQDRYSRGTFPDDVFCMAVGPYILGCWSREFEMEMEKRLSISGRFRAYARDHPYLLASQVVGGVAMTASVAALPVLGLVGFSASGPVMGSAVTAWHSSIGLAQAGSLFSWCQSAAMGGAAMNGIVAAGVTGGGVAMAATGAAAVQGQVILTPEEIKKLFLKTYRKEVGVVEGAAKL
ncbi:hypothetical protein BDR22DRAFT_825396 [Usnea florida]